MSAPQTNIEKQKRRHRPVIIGIAVAIALVVAAAFVIPNWVDERRAAGGSAVDATATEAPVSDY